MKFSASSAAVAAFAVNAAAQGVSGAAEGFAAGVTGGGVSLYTSRRRLEFQLIYNQSAAAVTPTTNEELVSYLGDSSPRTIVLTKTFDFTGSTVSGSGCAPWGTGAGCQTGRFSIELRDSRTCIDPKQPLTKTIGAETTSLVHLRPRSPTTKLAWTQSSLVRTRP